MLLCPNMCVFLFLLTMLAFDRLLRKVTDPKQPEAGFSMTEDVSCLHLSSYGTLDLVKI